jgi:membrane associated rhomboid family serine protease
VLQLLDGIGSLGLSQGGGVAFFAHIGGFVFGAAVAWLLTLLGRGGSASRFGVG